MKTNDRGYVLGLDAEAIEKLKSRMFFPMNDVIGFLSLAIVRAAAEGRARGETQQDNVQVADTALVVITGMYPALIEAIELVEEDLLKDPEQSAICVACKHEDKEGKAQCPGVLQRGDLLENLVGSALRIGMITILEASMQEVYGEHPAVPKESSVFDFFAPVLRTITDPNQK